MEARSWVVVRVVAEISGECGAKIDRSNDQSIAALYGASRESRMLVRETTEVEFLVRCSVRSRDGVFVVWEGGFGGLVLKAKN